MRVIAGEFKGIRLQSLPGVATRPTGDRVKEAMFSMLHTRLFNAQVLDLFSGSGALGIEALSRGAASAVLIDGARSATAVIKNNVARTGLGDRSQVWCMDAFAAMKRLQGSDKCFDVIFADPPYGKGLAQRVLEAINMTSLLKTSGILVIEHNHKEELTITKLNLKLEVQRKYGDTVVSMFQPVASCGSETVTDE